jgi:monoamine oxidase
MRDSEIIIIGAGAAGLMAAAELAKKKKQVTVLEAKNRLGGRIHTVRALHFDKPAELGAEFVHGNLPVTLKLLKQADIKYYPMEGQMWQSKNGELKHEYEFIEGSELLEKELKELKEDITVDEFLEKHFPGEKFSDLKRSVKRFVEGYDAADTTRASTFTLRDEWLTEDDAQQYRVKDGYGKLIEHLGYKATSNGCSIFLSSVVKEIRWQRGQVTVTTDSGETYRAAKALITVSLGVLQQEQPGESAMIFDPAVPEIISAARSMGFGSVIKILFQFSEPFWQESEIKKSTGHNLKKLGFLLSDAFVPTWWTQFPEESNMLTGWLAGPKAAQFKSAADEPRILEAAMNSLGQIFKVSEDYLKGKLTAHHIANWNADPFSLGGYAYATLHTMKSGRIMSQPIQDTLYFAGEAVYEGKVMGTVEAALTSGNNAAERILLRK